MQKVWKDYGAITLGTILIGLATKNILIPQYGNRRCFRCSYYWEGTLGSAAVGD